jgi:alpha-glucosidase
MQFMKRAQQILLLATLTAVAAPAVEEAGSWNLANEEKTLRFTLLLDPAGLGYEISHSNGRREDRVVERSPLGLTRRDEEFSGHLTFVSAGKVRKIDETYRMLIGKRSELRNRCREQAFTFRNTNGASLQVVARAYADGVAFAYRFPDNPGREITITGEATGFKMPLPGWAWMLPYEKVARWAPAYEMEWQNRIPVGTTAAEQYAGWAFPALFHVRDRWVLITEARLDGTCYAAHLEPKAEGGLYRVRLPEADETYGVAPREATAKLPWQSPWRAFIIGDSPAVIQESSLVHHLNPPCALKDTAWIKPGRVSWSWWSDMNSQQDFKKMVPYVDLSAALNWEYCLVDCDWQEMNNGTVWQLNDYAKSKGVGLILWYNSGGKHNQVENGPRDIMNDPVKRDAEMAKLEAAGIKGIKVDFMQSDKQYLVQLYLDIIRDAARHHLLVDFHGAMTPRGWSRTWPNLLSMEAIRGAEQYWDTNFAANAHTFHTIYTYTRNVVGPMDYTPVIFGEAPGRVPHRTTNPHELALAVAFESGLQHFADSAPSLLAQPDFVKDFLKVVPVAWDETRYLDGIPGELTLLARRKGRDWYVAGLNGQASARRVVVPLRFLDSGAYDAALISDTAEPRSFAHQEMTIRRGDALRVDLRGRGGFVLRLVKK